MLEHNVDIATLFEEGSEQVLESYLSLLHPADIAELFDLVPGSNAADETVIYRGGLRLTSNDAITIGVPTGRVRVIGDRSELLVPVEFDADKNTTLEVEWRW